MTWFPLYSISSQKFEEDLAILKKIFGAFDKKTHSLHGYKFSKEAKFVMGWWFYDIYVQKSFIQKLVEIEHIRNNKIKDERGIMKIIQNTLKARKSKARIKFHGEKPLYFGYWPWILR